ncbi:MAG TPA: hypothetical protein VFE62_00445, partial [Gemmataceae bacterium]|nr:hypothetical protein [Gemmataceae bacterium]
MVGQVIEQPIMTRLASLARNHTDCAFIAISLGQPLDLSSTDAQALSGAHGISRCAITTSMTLLAHAHGDQPRTRHGDLQRVKTLPECAETAQPTTSKLRSNTT